MERYLKSKILTSVLIILILFQILIRDISLPTLVELFGGIMGVVISVFVLQLIIKFILQKRHLELRNDTLFTLNISLLLYFIITVIIWILF